MSDETTPETVNPEPVPAPKVRKPRTGVVAKEVSTDGFVWVTILKAGAGRVHDGEGGLLERGERILVGPETAASLEARGFAETD